MNSTSFSQFIHGKTTGGRNYELVALTADLPGRESELETIAQQYRFWGAQPPDGTPIAVGVFTYGSGLLLVQAMQALQRGQPATDVQGRPYTQHRYVFIPPASLEGLAGRVWLLLNWVMEETRGIPVFSQFERNLPPLPAPRITANWYNPAEGLEKLTRALALRDDKGQEMLLSALAALVNRKRVIFDAAAANGVFSEDLLEGVLQLLPAACRPLVSIAAGALDERICTHADLMVKTNGPPAGPLNGDLIWAKRADNRFYGAVDDTTFSGNYTNLIQPIISQSASRPILLKILDGLITLGDSTPSAVWDALHNGLIAPHLIPAMPNPEQRARYWKNTLKNLTPEGWLAIIPTILDDTGLEIAWTELKQQVKRRPDAVTPVVFHLWQNFSAGYIQYVLATELPADPDLAEALFFHGLISHLGPDYHPALLKLALTLITQRAQRQPRQAQELAQLVQDAGLCPDPASLLALKEAFFPPQPDRAALLAFTQTDLLPVLPHLTADTFAATRISRELNSQLPALAELLKTVIARQAQTLDRLPELAASASLSLGQRAGLYAVCLTAWNPAYPAARPLFTDLVTQWIAAYAPEDRPHPATLFTGLTDWLTRRAPEAVAPLLSVRGVDFALEDWLVLAEDLYADPVSQVIFLDHVTTTQPGTPLLKRWLVVIAADPSALSHFEVSYTWHTLQTKGPAWLAEAVAQLLGWQAVSLSALLPVLERLQNALAMPQAVLFRFLESLPRHGDDDLGLILAAYLPQFASGQTADLESLPPWQMLNVQAPKVAQVYKILAEGQKNSAIDKFNQLKLTAALTEAPEYAGALAKWLQLCGKGTWISGRLLETLVFRWLANPAAIDPALLAGLLRPDVAASYTFTDWLLLAQIAWQPEYLSLWITTGQPDAGPRQHAQIVGAAKTCVSRYTSPVQSHKLLAACRSWGLSSVEQAEIISEIPVKACNFKLLHPYLYMNGSALPIQDHIAHNLVIHTLQLTITDAIEQAQLKLFVTRLLAGQLLAADGIRFITAWQTAATDSTLYQQSLVNAVIELAPEHFSLLLQRAEQLREQGNKKLSRIIITALDTYWQEQKKYFK